MTFPLPDGLTMGTLRFLNRDESFNPAPQYFAKNRATIEKLVGLDSVKTMHRINVVTETGRVIQADVTDKFYDALQIFVEDVKREQQRLERVRRFKHSRCVFVAINRFPKPKRKYLRPC